MQKLTHEDGTETLVFMRKPYGTGFVSLVKATDGHVFFVCRRNNAKKEEEFMHQYAVNDTEKREIVNKLITLKSLFKDENIMQEFINFV